LITPAKECRANPWARWVSCIWYAGKSDPGWVTPFQGSPPHLPFLGGQRGGPGQGASRFGEECYQGRVPRTSLQNAGRVYGCEYRGVLLPPSSPMPAPPWGKPQRGAFPGAKNPRAGTEPSGRDYRPTCRSATRTPSVCIITILNGSTPIKFDIGCRDFRLWLWGVVREGLVRGVEGGPIEGSSGLPAPSRAPVHPYRLGFQLIQHGKGRL